MRASFSIGAMTAGANEEVIARFSRLGGILGICFQIRDDIFDYYQTDIGKPTGNDIREGKISLPLIYALQHAPNDVSDEMMKIISSHDYTENNITKLLNFAKEYHGVEYAFGKMNEFLEEADRIISDFTFDNSIKTLMRTFLTYLKDRVY